MSATTPLKHPKKPEFPDSPCETVDTASTTSGEEDSLLEESEADENMELTFNVILNYAFSFSMIVVGALDILATILPKYVHNALETAAAEYAAEQALVETEVGADLESMVVEPPAVFPPEVISFVDFLDTHDVTINFIFAALWFANAFFDAHTRRNEAVMNAEKARLFAKDGEKVSTGCWNSPNIVYLRTIMMQLLLLPVGFYFILYQAFLRAQEGQDLWDIVGDVESMDEQIVLVMMDREDAIQYETYSSHSKRALLFAVIQHLWLKFSGETVRMAKSNLVAYLKQKGPTYLKNIFGNAIKHPIQFRRKVKKIMTTIRWAKYIAPLIGTGNKLKGNLSDLLKKRRQRIIAEKQKRIRQRLFEKKPLFLKKEDAARIIQSTYRAYYSRRATKAIMAIKGEKRYFAILRVQRKFRQKLQEARERLAKKKEELHRLEATSKKNSKKLTDEEKKRMYDLQDELGKEAKELINRKLLMRPNTTFAVVWKYLFVFCVIFEISNLAIRPWINEIKNKKTGDSIGMDEFVATYIVPSKVSELEQCKEYHRQLLKIEARRKPWFCNGKCQVRQYHERKLLIAELKAERPWYCREPVASLQGGFRDALALLIIPSNVTEWPECQTHVPSPNVVQRLLHQDIEKEPEWYCAEPYAEYHSIYRKIVDFVLEEFLIFVSIVCFLDVPITFFTGEIHPDTGVLIPKPFFARWILPGILLQMLVNPNIATVTKNAIHAWKEMVKHGPIRVFRWGVAVFFPIAYIFWTVIIEWIWMPLVHYENSFRLIPNSPF